MTALLIIGAAGVVGYLFSLRVHPLRKCPTCKMTGRHFSPVFPNNYRPCRTCGGTGRRDRLGVKVFYGGTGDTGRFTKR
jgi:hypothetical protein